MTGPGSFKAFPGGEAPRQPVKSIVTSLLPSVTDVSVLPKPTMFQMSALSGLPMVVRPMSRPRRR